MKTIVLKRELDDGKTLEATFAPDQGMNLISFKKADVEVIDQSTKKLFTERSAGLGALIGPHFHHRRAEIIPKVDDPKLFPHIARVRKKGVQEPFSHGIARYAPWEVKGSKEEFSAHLSGDSEWNGVPLSKLQGQNFVMKMEGGLTSEGLEIELSVVSDTDSLVGFHYYYALPKKKGKVHARVRSKSLVAGEWDRIPSEFHQKNTHHIELEMDREYDHGFSPFPDPTRGEVTLETPDYNLNVQYKSCCQENCWQLYHPKDESFVCIEPMSAQNPRKPILTASKLSLTLAIET